MPKPVVSESARRRRRPTKNGVVLSEDLIVRTALRMLREHGAAGLSVRRLGIALGADPSTLYRYFAGIDDLTLAIGDMLIGRAMDGWHATGDWRADLRELGLRIHAAYLEHPQAAVLTASRISGKSHEIAADEAILGRLRGAGFPDRAAVRVYHAFIDMTLAFAALDAASLALPEQARRADEEMWQATYARLSPAGHPNIAAVAPLLVADMNDSAYPAALDMLLAGAARDRERNGSAGDG
ncbi:TetR/AcrR family transcriptional regulator [Microbispora bryophytorum]|uniref:TetR family transcriptional regulator n=1 Tax=Microbispora bryophytorum TaxID=1460882 RepID=A0A8H9H071_9ACTN|nr:TetR/AcrR family transcriptional regulator [Microbispora bryophytorum]MBD3137018.1 TetR/AcrR family transcriptional regulator [Microbispora bryophytorum]TQS07278.1 TetR/AcrR family transcriptional regulator [Microbispora bryophytorum]GGO14052.1 TetR family transcriptional regulator [Microbispora bryophytorum]